MSRVSSTNSTASADVLNAGAHVQPVITVTHAQDHLAKSEMPAPLAAMVQVEQLISQVFHDVYSVVLLIWLLIVDDAIKLFTLWHHRIHTNLSFSFTGDPRPFIWCCNTFPNRSCD